MEIECGRTVPDYARHRAGFPASLLDRLAAFDVVTAGQCWHWFDRPAAAAEARRLLRPGGALVICHFDWLSLPGGVVRATEALILEHNPRWQGHGQLGIHPRWTLDVAAAGFSAIETFSYDIEVAYTHADWRGRVRASAGVGASLPEAAVERFDAELAKLLTKRFPCEPLAIVHRVWALVARRPASG